MKTTVGDIDIELWTKEAPKTCRNFIQLCLEDYYNNLIFHRVIPEFIVQGGDPKGDGTGGESIYGEPFKDEFHQRLRFSRRGLLAMANAGEYIFLGFVWWFCSIIELVPIAKMKCLDGILNKLNSYRQR